MNLAPYNFHHHNAHLHQHSSSDFFNYYFLYFLSLRLQFHFNPPHHQDKSMLIVILTVYPYCFCANLMVYNHGVVLQGELYHWYHLYCYLICFQSISRLLTGFDHRVLELNCFAYLVPLCCSKVLSYPFML